MSEVAHKIASASLLFAIAAKRKQDPLTQMYEHLLVFLAAKYEVPLSALVETTLTAQRRVKGPQIYDEDEMTNLIEPLYDDIAEMLHQAGVEPPDDIPARRVH